MRPLSIWVLASLSCSSAPVICVRPSISCTSRSDTSPSTCARRRPLSSSLISFSMLPCSVFKLSFSFFSVPSGSVIKPPTMSPISVSSSTP